MRVCSLTRFPRLFLFLLLASSANFHVGQQKALCSFTRSSKQIGATQRHETMPVMRASRTDGKQKVGGKAEQRLAMLLHSATCRS